MDTAISSISYDTRCKTYLGVLAVWLYVRNTPYRVKALNVLQSKGNP